MGGEANIFRIPVLLALAAGLSILPLALPAVAGDLGNQIRDCGLEGTVRANDHGGDVEICRDGTWQPAPNACLGESARNVCVVSAGGGTINGFQSCESLGSNGVGQWSSVCHLCDTGMTLNLSTFTCEAGGAASKPEEQEEEAQEPAPTAADASAHGTQQGDQKMQESASGLGSSQKESAEASRKVVELGANQAATAGALFCAEGANKAEEPEAAAERLRSCKEQFEAANRMLEMQKGLGAKDPGFSPDEATLGHEGAKATLSELERRYGIGGEEYMRRMLGARGGFGELSDIMGSALSSAQLGQLAAAGAETAAPPKESHEVSLAAGPKKTGTIRDALKKKLAEEARKLASAKAPPKEKGKGEAPAEDRHLEALGPDEAFGFAKEAGPRELTLFDVVRRKYDELTHRWALLPGKLR